MARIISFTLIRLLALGWVLILAATFDAIGPYAISILIIVSEAIFGYLWAHAEVHITVCKPDHEDPKLLFLLMLCVAFVEAILIWLIVGRFALWIIAWRAITAYFPFGLVEMMTYARKCRKLA